MAASNPWEIAYLRFETPTEETKKFTRRLRKLGAAAWPKNAAILDLFCGRGSGLRSLRALGFSHILGADLSTSLIRYGDRSESFVAADARHLPFRQGCKDIVIIQGGLHHLQELPTDLENTLLEIKRILKPQGKVVIVEPWKTAFLSIVHAVCANNLATRLSPKVKALADMIHNEKPTYHSWLGRPTLILDLLTKHFDVLHRSVFMGKLYFLGTRRHDK
jgi:ubiquinone/menaquinone biosynthesis C-methylase UbiE